MNRAGNGAGRRRGRDCVGLDGVLLLDKAAGMTSNEALQAAKRLLRACKAGHTGSLDPIATGLLPLTFGEATKLSQFLLDADKRYWTLLRLGASTTTYDTEGEVTDTHPVALTLRAIERAVGGFVGEIDQLPPMYSAVKYRGQALYTLARAGVEVERTPRRVRISELRIVRWEGADLELDIACSKGTYIRTLAHDLGKILGCGAHVAQLRRLAVGDLQVAEAVTLHAIEAAADPAARAALLRPVDQALPSVPGVNLTPLAAHYLRRGQVVSVRHEWPPGWVRLYGDGGSFLGMGEVLDDGRVAPRRLLHAGGS